MYSLINTFHIYRDSFLIERVPWSNISNAPPYEQTYYVFQKLLFLFFEVIITICVHMLFM